jgi:SAM-dependent methyltransferase
MSLSEEYKKQFPWRSWSTVLEQLPPLADRLLLDLGCGVGDQTAQLAARGARVIGIDANEDLLVSARERAIPNAEFRNLDLRDLGRMGIAVDGIWCSFTAAYFPDFAPVLASWASLLKPGGWIALTEVNDLFGHEPIPNETRSLLAAYAQDAVQSNRYDFHMGSKLRHHVELAGFVVSSAHLLEDKELSFVGPAEPAVLEAWRSRLDRMKLLKDFCGVRFDRVHEDMLGTLIHPHHRSIATVHSCIGIKRSDSCADAGKPLTVAPAAGTS